MNYLIFGGSGFIGTHLIHRLKDACVKPGDCIYDLDLVMPGEEGVVPGVLCTAARLKITSSGVGVKSRAIGLRTSTRR